MIEDVLSRGWENFVARTTGSMSFRFILQPAVAVFIAILAGLKDSREGRPAFLWSILTKTGSRMPLLREGLMDTSKVLILAVILDAVYQLLKQRGIYALELVFTAATLALVPYLIIRGPANRMATWLRSHRKRTRPLGEQ